MGKLAKAISLVYICFAACTDSSKNTSVSSGNSYARGFTIGVCDGMIRATVVNPWEKARNVKFEYHLVPHEQKAADSLTGPNLIRIPARRIVCMSTSHLAFLEALGECEAITGVSGSQYITSPCVRERISEGLARDVGYGQNLNFEEIIRQKPDVVMVYGVDSEVTGFLGKFRDLGIPAILVAEYLEGSPLGKAEWIRFVGALVGKQEMADSIFRAVESNYLSLKSTIPEGKEMPAVMTGLPYRDSWWVPGGRSYLANLIHDAGGMYLFEENESHESFVISMEEAIIRSSSADFWIHTGMVTKKDEILASDSRFAGFPMFRKAAIYNNNRRSSPAGGNDFWESGTVFPDRILADLIRIFHPGLLPSDTLTYYIGIR
jgi:iron complex transport system substrate-binding protein